MADLTIKSTPSGFFAVYRGASRISQTFITYARAEHEMSIFRSEDGPYERKCLCCEVMFMSEGPHHRMCRTHRPVSPDMMMQDQQLAAW